MVRPWRRSVGYIAPMLAFAIVFIFVAHLLEFPSALPPRPVPRPARRSPAEPFADLAAAYSQWDADVGCNRFRENHSGLASPSSSVQDVAGERCPASSGAAAHVTVLVKEWTWIPDSLNNLYSCRCGMTCLWTKSAVLADKPDALLFEYTMPPSVRHKGDPLRVFLNIEAERKRSGFEDIFIGYHASDDVQCTYAGASFHSNRNYQISSQKKNDVLVYWSSSRCLPHRDRLAKSFLSLVPHHSFGKCLNNVGGTDMALSLYPECSSNGGTSGWWDHLHCSMSHYKFVLAVENTAADSYVTEKLFYALDAGSVPIYFGAPNVRDFVPPNSVIDGSEFGSMEELARYVLELAGDPVAYAEFHAWRRCGALGGYGSVRAASLDTLPCRLCEAVSRRGGRNATAL